MITEVKLLVWLLELLRSNPRYNLPVREIQVNNLSKKKERNSGQLKTEIKLSRMFYVN